MKNKTKKELQEEIVRLKKKLHGAKVSAGMWRMKALYG